MSLENLLRKTLRELALEQDAGRVMEEREREHQKALEVERCARDEQLAGGIEPSPELLGAWLEPAATSEKIIEVPACGETALGHSTAQDAERRSDFKQYLKEQMTQNEKTPPGFSRAKYEEIAKNRYGIGARSFERIWTAAKEETGRGQTWSKAGRKPRTR